MASLKLKEPQLAPLYHSGNLESFSALSLSTPGKFRWHCSACSGEKLATIKALRKSTLCASCSRSFSAQGRSSAALRRAGAVADNSFPASQLWKDSTPAATIPQTSKRLFTWACRTCQGLFRASPYDFLRRDKPHSGHCRTCSSSIQLGKSNATRLLKRSTVAFSDSLLKEWDYARNEGSPEDFTLYSAKKAHWLCGNCGHSYEAAIHNRSYGGTGCPRCGRRSYLEELVEDELRRLEVSYERNTFPLRTPEGRRLQLDFLLPAVGLAIEVQDFASHDPTLEQVVTHIYGKPIVKKGPSYHAFKRALTREQLGLPLLELWEDDLRSGVYRELLKSALEEPASVFGDND